MCRSMSRREFRYGGRPHRLSRQGKHALILLVVGAWLLSRGVFPAAWILLLIAAVQGARWLSDPRRAQIAKGRVVAARHGLAVPDDPWIWSALEQVEHHRAAAGRSSPALAANFDEVVASLWQELRRVPATAVAWREVLTRVLTELRQWPQTPDEASASPLDESLKRLRRASKLWNEARREATT